MKLRSLQTTLAIFAIGTAALAIFGTAACGNTESDCVTICQDRQKCSGATTQDCNQKCTDYQTAAQASACSSTYVDAIDCVNGLTDKCNLGDCQGKVNAASSCILTYCAGHLNDPACKKNFQAF